MPDTKGTVKVKGYETSRSANSPLVLQLALCGFILQKLLEGSCIGIEDSKVLSVSRTHSAAMNGKVQKEQQLGGATSGLKVEQIQLRKKTRRRKKIPYSL